MSMFESTFEHEHFYNKFIKEYNKSSDRVNTISEIKNQRDLLAEKEKREEIKVSGHLNKLKEISKLPIFPRDPSEKELNILNIKALKKVLKDFSFQIERERHIHFSEYILEIFRTAIEKSFPTESIELYPATECIRKAEAISHLGESIKMCREKQKLLNKLIDQAIDDNYQLKLNKWENPSGEDNQILHGAPQKTREQKENSQAVHYPQIYKAAIQVIGDKKLSDFTTDTGNANSDLYKSIFRRYDNVALGTLKDWLNEDLKSGEFKKGLEKMREELKKMDDG